MVAETQTRWLQPGMLPLMRKDQNNQRNRNLQERCKIIDTYICSLPTMSLSWLLLLALPIHTSHWGGDGGLRIIQKSWHDGSIKRQGSFY